MTLFKAYNGHLFSMTAYDRTDIEKDAKKADTAWVKSDFSGKHVLLAEDTELNREIADVILTESGFPVESAPDGTEALLGG